MKTIDLKETEVNGQPFLYKEELKLILQSPTDPQRGADIGEMRKAMRVLDALDKATDVLVLEDADYDYLKGRMNSARFRLINPIIVQFIEDVTTADTPEDWSLT